MLLNVCILSGSDFQPSRRHGPPVWSAEPHSAAVVGLATSTAGFTPYIYTSQMYRNFVSFFFQGLMQKQREMSVLPATEEVN